MKRLALKTVALLACLLCSLSAVAAEAYANYTSGNTTLTFYYDDLRSERTGTTYDLNEGEVKPAWRSSVINTATQVEFDPSFAAARPTTTYYWFCSMKKLTSIIGLEYLNTSEVTDMRYMFKECSQLTSLDLRSFNTENVTNMLGMFTSCSHLTSIDLSGWNTAKVTNMSTMFWFCSALTTIYVGSEWTTASVTSSSTMFGSCTSIVGGKGTTFDSRYTDKTYARIDRGQSYPGYFTETSPEAYAVYTPENTTLTFYYDNFRSSRSDTTYDLNIGYSWPQWYNDSTNRSVTRVVFYPSFADARPTSTYYWFFSMANLQSISGINFLNTSQVTNMSAMFSDCHELTSLDLSSFNTAKVTNMSGMFYDCYELTSLDLSNFNTANVTNMSGMFKNCKSLTSLDLSSFNTSNVTSMSAMFLDCYALTSLDLSSFNTSNVTIMPSMFYNCTSLTSLDVSSFNTANVSDMTSMFYECTSLTSLDLSTFNAANVAHMAFMFYECKSLTTLDLSSFNTANVKSMKSMFDYCNNLTTIIAGDGWSTDAVTESSSMFYYCTNLVGGMGTTYDVNHVDKEYAHIDGGSTNPGYFTAPPEAYVEYTSANSTLTFYYDSQRSGREGTTFDLNEGANAPGWYQSYIYSAVKKVVFDPSFADARPTTTYYWFYNMTKLQSITNLEYLNTSEVTNMSQMFYFCQNLITLDLSHFNTAKVTDMSSMFNQCRALIYVDVFSFNTENVTSMRSMFNNCLELQAVNLCRFNTSNVIDMGYMFNNCKQLTSLNLSSFNTANVTNMSYMFQNCSSLVTIYAGDGWTTDAVTSGSGMFTGCTSLVGGQGTTYDANHLNKAYAHLDGGTSNPGYFSEKSPEPYAVYTSENTTLTFYYDTNRDSCPVMTYNMNPDNISPDWVNHSFVWDVTQVVFDPSFEGARPKNTYHWFEEMYQLLNITGIEYLNTSEVTNMSNMFSGCSKLTNLDVSGFNTENVTDMSCMFKSCGGLKTLDLSNFNTANVTSMSNMFNYCIGLRSLDLSSFNTAKVTSTNNMFRFCSELTTIYVGSGWTTDAITSSNDMFFGCTKLMGDMGTTYDRNHVDKAYAHIDGGTSNPGYLSKVPVLRGDVNGDGRVNVADVTEVIDYMLYGDEVDFNFDAADTNGDGRVNIGDVADITDYILHGHWF